MDYGEVLSKAWKIIWKHKILWIFGILASCGRSGGGGGGNAGSRFQQNQPNGNPFNSYPFNRAQEMLAQVPVWVWILLALVVLILLVVFVVLNTIGRIGLVRGVVQADEGAASLSFGDLFSGSFRYFWRVFFLNLVISLAILVVFVLIGALFVLIGVATLGVGLLCLVPLICPLVLVLWALGVIIEQSNIALVSEDLGIFSALQRGWEIVIRNFGPYILMAIILGIGSAVIGFVVAIPLIAIAIPVMVAAMAGGSRALGSGIFVSVLLFLVYLPVLIVLSGILQTYVFSAWTLTFRRLTGHGPQLAPLAPPAPPTTEPFGS
jgi:hypothetical protein